MSLKINTKYRIIEKDNKYYLQEKEFIKWKHVFTYAGLNKPFGFNTIESLKEKLLREFWWKLIVETREHDDSLFIRAEEIKKEE